MAITAPARPEQYMEVNGLRLCYRDLGDPAHKPVLFLHGLMGHSHEWEVLLADLARDHRVIALDQRGHGKSDWATSYSSDEMMRDAVEVIRALGLTRPHVIGHSMGGMITMLLGAQHPDLVNKIVLLDVAPDCLDSEWGRQMLPVTLDAFAAARYSSVKEAVDQWMAGDPLAQRPLIKRYVEYALKEVGDGTLAWGFDAAHLIEFVHGASAEKLRDALGRIEASTLVIRGEHSELLTAEYVRRMGALLRDMSYAQVAGAAHDLGVQQPQAVAAAVRGFLEN